MCERRSMTSTLSPNSLAARSATVSPKKPEPTIRRSTDTSTPSRMETTSNEPTVGNPANSHRNQAIAAANDHIASILQPGREPDLAKLALQPQFCLQLTKSTPASVGTVTHAVHDQGLRQVVDLRARVDHAGEQPVVLHQPDIDVAARLLDRGPAIHDGGMVERIVEARVELDGLLSRRGYPAPEDRPHLISELEHSGTHKVEARADALHLLFEPFRQRDVIGVHARNDVEAAGRHPVVERVGKPLVLGQHDEVRGDRTRFDKLSERIR